MTPEIASRFGVFGGRYVPETLVPALDELDARYLAGEGAVHANVLNVAHRAALALRDDDLDEYGRCISDDFVGVSHFAFGFELGDVLNAGTVDFGLTWQHKQIHHHARSI